MVKLTYLAALILTLFTIQAQHVLDGVPYGTTDAVAPATLPHALPELSSAASAAQPTLFPSRLPLTTKNLLPGITPKAFFPAPATLSSSQFSALLHKTDLPAWYIPPVPLGFFCRFEDNLARKLPVPLNFGTD
jgi:hypothetical protein